MKITAYWKNYYALLSKWVKLNGKLPDETVLYKQAKIGSWLKSQRSYNNTQKLTNEKIELLLKLDNNIFKNFRQYVWEEQYYLYKKFKEIYKRFPRQDEYFKEKTIKYAWKGTQRHCFRKNKLSEKKVQLLLEIDKNFFCDYSPETTWNKHYKIIKKLKKQGEKIPRVHYVWLCKQISVFREGILSTKHYKLLTGIDEKIFENKNMSWEKNYCLYKEFMELNKRPPMRDEYFKGKRISNCWLNYQKIKQKKNQLSVEKIKLLNELNKTELWNVDKDDYVKAKWEKNYMLYKRYKEQKNGTSHKLTDRKVMGVNNWIKRQKKNYNLNILTKEQIKQLIIVDENIFENNGKINDEKTWKKNYKLFKESERVYANASDKYRKKFTGKYKGINVQEWVKSQNIAYINKELTKNQIILLKKVKINIFFLY